MALTVGALSTRGPSLGPLTRRPARKRLSFYASPTIGFFLAFARSVHLPYPSFFSIFSNSDCFNCDLTPFLFGFFFLLLLHPLQRWFDSSCHDETTPSLVHHPTAGRPFVSPVSFSVTQRFQINSISLFQAILLSENFDFGSCQY